MGYIGNFVIQSFKICTTEDLPLVIVLIENCIEIIQIDYVKDQPVNKKPTVSVLDWTIMRFAHTIRKGLFNGGLRLVSILICFPTSKIILRLSRVVEDLKVKEKQWMQHASEDK